MNRMTELLERINYDLPGLKKAKMCYAQGDADGAMDAVIEHFCTRTTPKYLFTAKEMEQCKVDGILEDAQETLDHYIYGHKFDGEIDWFFNPTEHTSHDNEWTWSLYRHIYWQPLARAYALTKDEKYTKEFLHEMTEWGKAWPVTPFMENEEDAAAKYKFPGHSWRTIETAMRIYTVWLPCMEAFRTSPAWDREGWVTFLTLLCDHADFLMTHYSNHKKSSNWLTMESGTLLECGILFPEIKSDWFMTGYRRVMQEVKYSFDNDGIHMERTPIYHMVAAGVYFQCYRLRHSIELMKKTVPNMPIMAKLAIESTDALTSMRIAEAAGAAAAGPTARWKGYYMDLDWRGTEARPGAGYGGTQATPLVCYSIAEARTAGVKLPLYGGGGVFNYENAARILMAGSEMVQLGALACAGGTMACKKLISDLNSWMDENGYADMDSLVGDSLKLFQMDADFTKKRQNKLADAYQTADADRTKCIGCGRCEDVCWHQGIEIKERKAYKTDKCIGCGYCFQVCPTQALYVDKKGILRSAFEEAGIRRGNK